MRVLSLTIRSLFRSVSSNSLLPNMTTEAKPDISGLSQAQQPPPQAPTQQSNGKEVTGTKRKRSADPKFYAVKIGFKPGVYHKWSDCLAQVTGFKGAVFQSFPSLEEADAFLTGNRHSSPKGPVAPCTKFYAVQKGRVPGVYTDWAKAQNQVSGFRGPKYRRFATQKEAEAYVREGEERSTLLRGAPGMQTEPPKDKLGNIFPAGTGPLPPGAEDGFDPNILLNSKGEIVYKTPEQKAIIKLQPKPTLPPGMLKIYTDGSALRNGGAGAKAGVGVYFGPEDERNVSEPLEGDRQTNQRAELTAISRALDIAPRHRDVTIFTDSKYSINCVTLWCQNWLRNNWMTSNNKPVENKDLIQSILAKIETRETFKVKTLFEWVKGHSLDPGNEAADRLAVNGAGMVEAGNGSSKVDIGKEETSD